MDILSQKFLVLGVSKSGIASSKLLLKMGATVFLYDDLKTPRVDKSIKELEVLGAVDITENIEEKLSDIDIVVISPGVPINHKVAVMAKGLKKKIIGEIELAYLSKLPVVIGVTGTNGKTTTVSMIDNLLNESRGHFLCGNVGVPFSEKIAEGDYKDVFVCEISSFQLESAVAFCPHIACILNITPDHLERHYTMENYIFVKKKILSSQTESEIALLNYDDETVKSFEKDCKGKVYFVSTKQAVKGAYRLDGKLYFNGEFIINEADLPFFGEHNIYNALFSVACAKLIGVKNENIVVGLKTFKGVKHRIEFVAKKNGVKYYNDSKATNTASTLCALNALNGNLILILGGSEKGERYQSLFKEIKKRNIKVIITGASTANMVKDAVREEFFNFNIAENMQNAFELSENIAKCGDSVLLSPACASFDEFTCYEERGECFRNFVESISENVIKE